LSFVSHSGEGKEMLLPSREGTAIPRRTMRSAFLRDV
jgi:hypothetical protein